MTTIQKLQNKQKRDLSTWRQLSSTDVYNYAHRSSIVSSWWQWSKTDVENQKCIFEFFIAINTTAYFIQHSFQIHLTAFQILADFSRFEPDCRNV